MKTKGVILFGLVLFILSSCCNDNCSKDDGTTDSTACDTVKKEVIVKLSDIKNNAGEYIDKEITIKGVASHVCYHSGNKMFVMADDIEAPVKLVCADNIERFDTLLEGKNIIAKGILREKVIDSSYVKDLELKLAEMEAEEHKEEDHEDHGDIEEADGILSHHADMQPQIDSYKKQLAESEDNKLYFYSIECSMVKEDK